MFSNTLSLQIIDWNIKILLMRWYDFTWFIIQNLLFLTASPVSGAPYTMIVMPLRLRAARPSGDRSTQMWRAIALETGVVSSCPSLPLLPSLVISMTECTKHKLKVLFWCNKVKLKLKLILDKVKHTVPVEITVNYTRQATFISMLSSASEMVVLT